MINELKKAVKESEELREKGVQNYLKEDKCYLEEWTDEELDTLVSDWNGEDSRFMSQGDIYHEEDVYIAREILEERGTLKD